MPNLISQQPNRGWSFWWKPALFVLVACIGLYYVKWSPYYLKAFVAADNHSIGASILNDQQSSPLAAALAYAQVYFLAIWKAAVLAVILGSLLQVLIPATGCCACSAAPGWVRPYVAGCSPCRG